MKIMLCLNQCKENMYWVVLIYCIDSIHVHFKSGLGYFKSVTQGDGISTGLVLFSTG